MGVCYSVVLKTKVLNEQGAIRVLNKHIQDDRGVNYSLDSYASEGITTDTFDDLMRIFLAGWKGQEVTIYQNGDFVYYENDFDASYGWEYVMIAMFEVLAPYLQDGSQLTIYPDNEREVFIVKNGKSVSYI